jgi:hypothetical protein
VANNLGYTPGSPASVATIQASSDGSQVQLVSLSAIGATGDRSPIPTDATKGLGVQVLAVTSGVTFAVVNNGSAKLAVDGSGVTQPVSGSVSISGTPSVAQSGTWNIGTVTSISGTVTVAGTVSISGTVAATQSGTWNIGTVTSITNPVTVTGSVSVSGTATVSGTVTANQGTPAAIANSWYARISDGTNPVGVTNVSGSYGLKVDVIKQTGGGYSQQDKTGFTEGTTFVEVIGGVYNDSFAGSPSAGQASVTRITPNRAFHVNLRNNSGTEIGTSGAPVYVQASTANFPINVVQIAGNNVSTAAAGVQLVGISDNTGTAYGPTNPLQVQNAPSGKTGGATQTIWKNAATFSASQTDIALRTPGGGKIGFVEGIVITVQTSGVLKIYDNTNAAANMIYQGTPPAGACIPITPSRPIPLSAANNILRFSTGSGATGDIACWGYDA